ncbi:pyruvate dehydrogenase (acetyl-transferring) E1 component subunit alpha [Isoptericola sp. BMS4]|uniref:pyruvate dehydrogenase (acetyl-transferring) E1 component subunit alpha n=1 Tax=Isoptericola sp. BMS4 TaxID=2527875 RepID=UPI00141EAF5F|nr:pyruvate dehydrogenase (acetyl-transferring) E1 component subunit alpha [Isoptericola sp. BMS4]
MPSTMGSKARVDPSRAGTAREHEAGERTSTPAVHDDTDTGAPAGTDDVRRLLDRTGARHPDPALDRWLADVDAGDEAAETLLRRMYADMVVSRRLDAEATALQRQGELALWPPLLGQEAAQVGSARALRDDDFVFSSYREHAVAMIRGVRPEQVTPVWRGVAASGWNPYDVGMATPQVIIGAQALHAVGYAFGILCDAERDPGRVPDGGTAATVAYVGDGAMSQGDVSEALLFAATWSTPTVFVCQNNQWAISEPVSLQAPVPLAERGTGFGVPGVRVDGNDVLAVLAVTREALHRARTGGGPTLIEAVTYRMGPHTTADDPTRYRSTEEVESWRRRDPIERYAAWLRARGTLTDAVEQEVRETADRTAAELRAGCLALTDPPASRIFEHVYAEPHAALAAERDAYADYLATLGDEAPAEAEGGAR